MIVKGPILIPDIPDLAGEVLDEQTIRKATLIITRNGVTANVQQHYVGKILELYV